MQQEVEASRSSNACCGFAGVEIKDEGKDNERYVAKVKRSLAVELGFEKGKQARVPGSLERRFTRRPRNVEHS